MKEFIILLLAVIVLIFDIFIYIKNHKNIKISSQNKILFYKLKKQFLNNTSITDIEQLKYFLDKEIKERKNKK